MQRDPTYSRSVILAAGLLVLLGLGLFVGGVLTGMTAFYWGCVAACVVAAILLFLARRKLTAGSGSGPATGSAPRGASRADAVPSAPAPVGSPGLAATGEAATAAPERDAAPAGATAASAAARDTTEELADPPVEEVEVTDLLLVVDLKDEVLVVDEHPRYHLPGCPHIAGRTTIPIPLDEARTDGFTPCAVCAPDRNLAQRARDRKAAG